MRFLRKRSREILGDLLARFPILSSCRKDIIAVFLILQTNFTKGGKVLVCGNGGSAADAMHIVGELMKDFMIKRPLTLPEIEKIKVADPDSSAYFIANLCQSLPAMSLVGETAFLTAYMNDVDSQMIFAQQVYSYGKPGDVLIALSTSGNSPNIVNAAKIARAFDLIVIGFTGENGGLLLPWCDECICVPSNITPEIQEFHLPIYHSLCAMLEAEFFG